MWKLKDFGSSLENAFGSYSEIEILVREATCEEPWGPTNKQMEVLCDFCKYDPEYSELMNMLWFRITHEPQKSWKRVYKGLLIIDYLLKNGPERLVQDVIENLKYLDIIKSYKYFDDDRVEKTINITHRASLIHDLVNDHEKLRQERKTIKTLKQRLNNAPRGPSSKNDDKSLALKARSAVQEVIGIVSNKRSNPRKSFYESSNKVFNTASNSLYKNSQSNQKIYRDEDGEKPNPINITHISTQTLDQNTNEDFGEFVDFNKPPRKKSMRKNNDDLLLDIFGEESVPSSNPQLNPLPNPKSTLDDIFSIVDNSYTPSPQQSDSINNPFFTTPGVSQPQTSYMNYPFVTAPVVVSQPQTSYMNHPFVTAPVLVSQPQTSYMNHPFATAPGVASQPPTNYLNHPFVTTAVASQNTNSVPTTQTFPFEMPNNTANHQPLSKNSVDNESRPKNVDNMIQNNLHGISFPENKSNPQNTFYFK